MRSVNLLVFTMLVAATLSAQKREIEFGVLAGYGILNSTVSGKVADRYIIYSNSSTLDGFRLGAFGKVIKERGFWSSELSYYNNRSLINFHNLKWEEDLAAYGNASIDASGIYFNNMIRTSIHKGFSILKLFSFEGGLVAAIQLKDRNYSDYPDNYFDPATMTKVIYQVADGFNRFLVLGTIRLAYNFGPISVYGSVERSFTPVSNHIKFENVKYPLEYRIGTYEFGIKYTLFNLK